MFGDGAEMVRWRADADPPPSGESDAIVLYGAETNIEDAPSLPWLQAEQAWLSDRVAAGVPLLGLCFGAQLLASALGGAITRCDDEIGFHPVTLTAAGRADPVLGVLPERFLAAQWHSWQFALPPGATPLGYGPAGLQAFRSGHVLAVQFHPEVDMETLDRWVASSPAKGEGFAERAALLPRWNELGRRLFRSFLRSLPV